MRIFFKKLLQRRFGRADYINLVNLRDFPTWNAFGVTNSYIDRVAIRLRGSTM